MKLLFLTLMLIFVGGPANVIAADCKTSKSYDEGAFECSGQAEVVKGFDKNYAFGVAESRMWKAMFEHCKKTGKRLSDTSLIPVPISGSRKQTAEKLETNRIHFSVTSAFYCGGL